MVRSSSRRVRQTELDTEVPRREENLQLNTRQRQALDAILASLRASRYRQLLLHGVTGSGKTEVYMQAIQEVVSYGRQAIVLVPEISLTPQTKSRFRARFDSVAVLHSHLSDVERHWHWERIAAGEIQVVVGARSAVFAPTPHLGLIVIDEEHETSFKQDSAPRYHAREVARYRAECEQVPLVLGSATPALESWHAALTGEAELIELPDRVMNLPMPAVQTIDLRLSAGRRLDRGAISRQLYLAMRDTLNDGGQVILLLNRRGFSTHIQCPSCGHAVRCPRCEIDLTYHKQDVTAICHHCDFTQPAPNHCEKCNFAGIRYTGIGTQRLEAEVRARFAGHTCLRMDTDTMKKPGSHEAALDKFRDGQIDILLGTQMIAKGLDFPNVMLVGVVNADMALHLPDFRAAERTFQLVTQVAGRTGRGARGGRVLVQTFEPDNPAIQAAIRHDYGLFAAGELPLRESLHYPPFASMVRFVIRGPSEPQTLAFADDLLQRLQDQVELLGDEHARVLGPAPAPIPKTHDLYRFNIQCHATDGAALREAVRRATRRLAASDEIAWIADVDPVNML
ncbi:MAG: primosomal protein N' [Pirellulales bacterium]